MTPMAIYLQVCLRCDGIDNDCDGATDDDDGNVIPPMCTWITMVILMGISVS